MDLVIKNITERQCACDALIIPMAEDHSGPFDMLGAATGRIILKSIPKGAPLKRNEFLLIPASDNIRPARILLVGMGKKAEVTAERTRQAGGRSSTYLKSAGMSKVALSSVALTALGADTSEFVEGFLLSAYSYERYHKEQNGKALEGLTVLSRHPGKLKDSIIWRQHIAEAVHFTRDLVNAPANDMTPSHLAKSALSLRKKNLKVKVLDAKAARKLGMGAYLSVARGSHEPARFIVLEYNGAKGSPLVIIGKSITFDSGGINLKPSDGLEKMKYDMAGGAAVLGVMKAASEARLPVRIVGILPAAENLPGGSATRPGDVVKAMDGKTVEVINTDAEGRLSLADALVFAKRFRPSGIIDIATLTGACSIALGNEAIAMMGNDRTLLDAVRQSADETYERVWEMPLFEEYKEYMKSDIADIKNASGRTGSLVTSASFLNDFADGTPWVHLDIAGTAWTEKDRPYTPKGASGIGVRLLLNLLEK